MNLIEFTQRFGTEKQCINFIKKEREKRGLTCKKCKKKVTKWNAESLYWRCSCGKKISLKSGTIMQSTKVPYHKWFYAIYLMTHIKKPYSCLELSRVLQIKRYGTAWYLMMKIRIAMANNLFKTQFSDFLILISNDNKSEQNLTSPKNNSLVAVSYNPRKGTDLINLLAPSEFLNSITIKEQILQSGDYRYPKILGVHSKIEIGVDRFPFKDDVKRWLVNILSNCKRNLNGIHHGVSDVHLQKYLIEFSFNYNYRRGGKLETLVNEIFL